MLLLLSPKILCDVTCSNANKEEEERVIRRRIRPVDEPLRLVDEFRVICIADQLPSPSRPNSPFSPSSYENKSEEVWKCVPPVIPTRFPSQGYIFRRRCVYAFIPLTHLPARAHDVYFRNVSSLVSYLAGLKYSQR